MGGIDLGAIPKSDFNKVRKWKEGASRKARNYDERLRGSIEQLEMYNK